MTRLFALLGDPVEHSLSPTFQNAAIAALSLDARYERVRTPDSAALEATRDAMRAGDLAGANITLPHKAAAAALADAREADVEALGVANTWTRDGERIVAANTDVDGARRALAQANAVDAQRIAVFGAGGATPALLLAADRPGVEGWVMNRTRSRAEALVSRLAAHLRGRWRAGAWGHDPGTVDLVVDATALAHVDPETARIAWAAAHLDAPAALSLSYGPGTASFFDACHPSARRADGLTMLLHQGAASFTRWWRRDAPVDAMRTALAEAAGVPPSSIG